MSLIKDIEERRTDLSKSFNALLGKIGKVKIGEPHQFPYGWRKAAKGRTVWRILEELITQNLEKHFKDIGLTEINPAESEVGVYDLSCKVKGHDKKLYVNVKSSVKGGRKNKDDISKAAKLQRFFSEDEHKELYIATFSIDFNNNMTISISEVVVFPIMWIPDIYVNPSNNGNLQSSKYKNLKTAIERTGPEFIVELDKENEIARKKREAKRQSK